MQYSVVLDRLQNLIKQKISYEQVAKILGLGSKQAAYNRVTRKTPLKQWEIIALDEAFLKNSKINIQKNTTFGQYYFDFKKIIASDYFFLI